MDDVDFLMTLSNEQFTNFFSAKIDVYPDLNHSEKEKHTTYKDCKPLLKKVFPKPFFFKETAHYELKARHQCYYEYTWTNHHGNYSSGYKKKEYKDIRLHDQLYSVVGIAREYLSKRFKDLSLDRYNELCDILDLGIRLRELDDNDDAFYRFRKAFSFIYFEKTQYKMFLNVDMLVHLVHYSYKFLKNGEYKEQLLDVSNKLHNNIKIL